MRNLSTISVAPASLLTFLFACGLAATSLAAEKKTKRPDPALLSIERIYGKKEFESKHYSARWLDDGSSYTRLEDSKSPGGGRDIVRYDAQSGERETMVPAAHLLPPGEKEPLSIDGYQWSADMSKLLIYTNSKRVWRKKSRGDYWVLDRSSRELRKLGGEANPATLQFAKFSPDGSKVAYVRERNIYVEDLRERTIKALTTGGGDVLINGTFDWVYEEELSLRDGFRWSPDGERIAYWQLDTSGVRKFTLINNTAGPYPKLTRFCYPKVGEKNSAGRIGVVGTAGGATRWMNVPGDPRNHYIARMDFSEHDGQIVLQQLNRLQNTIRLMRADPKTGRVKTILTDRDDAWVRPVREMEWLNKGKQFTWVSERDGWRHVYLASPGGEPKLVTPGKFDAIALSHVDEKRRWLYYIASPDTPTQRYLFRVRLDGTKSERITPTDQPGTHRYDISPDGNWAIHSYSTINTPPVTDIVALPGHKVVRVLEDNEKLREKVAKLARAPIELFRVDIGGGVLLDAYCIKPPKMDASKKYPLLVYVYGEPGGQTVRDTWSGGALWHQMLAQQGYIVMSFDNRGTNAPRGRAWRKFIHRNIGVLAPKDQAAAVRAVIAKRPYIDAERIGIWGASGGGSMSLNAIFKYPDLYHTAVAIASVPVQRYYDTIYQERYMGLPADNVEGFRDGSPINFAKQLQGNLLIIHGTGDDNCHYQGAEALINELIRHNRPFSMMAYPNRTHALREGVNTRRHLKELMTRYLQSNLPPGPRER
ncbi:MAG: S9 family peptidase [Planctomycetes bacterium]|nr:S9 family peptidase [Planctomycetota bacterium]